MVDYSKWSKIEVSDDEDDTHPNIDTPSLFRWRHRARIERMEALQLKVDIFYKNKKELTDRIRDYQLKVEKSKNDKDPSLIEYQQKLTELEEKLKNMEAEEVGLNKEIKSQPLNVDTISKPGFDKSVIKKPTLETSKIKSEESIAKDLKTFIETHKKEVKNFGMLSSWADSGQYLKDHPEIACEEAANYLCLWCIDLAVEEKIALMERAARQTVSLQFLLELASVQKCPPQQLVPSFFARMAKMDGDYAEGFNNELESFKKRVSDRAKERIKEAMEKVKEEERQKRLGPGGLDPLEIMETLPPSLKECFEKKDVELLKKVLLEMPQNEADYHFKRCIDSGLWVQNADKTSDNAEEQIYESEVIDIPEDDPSEVAKLHN